MIFHKQVVLIPVQNTAAEYSAKYKPAIVSAIFCTGISTYILATCIRHSCTVYTRAKCTVQVYIVFGLGIAYAASPFSRVNAVAFPHAAAETGDEKSPLDTLHANLLKLGRRTHRMALDTPTLPKEARTLQATRTLPLQSLWHRPRVLEIVSVATIVLIVTFSRMPSSRVMRIAFINSGIFFSMVHSPW
jgi:hypothetical protein